MWETRSIILTAGLYGPIMHVFSFHSFHFCGVTLRAHYIIKVTCSVLQGPPNNFYFSKRFKITTEYFFKFQFFILQSFRLIMENNFIQMAASAGHAISYTIGPIFRHNYRLCATAFRECCHLKRQLSLACRHPTNNSPTLSNRSSKVARRH